MEKQIMKNNIPIIILITLLLLLYTTLVRAQGVKTDTTIRIMPLGDSITMGYITGLTNDLMVGYRQKLYLDLINEGYTIDFAGSLHSGSLAAPNFDYHHEGHGGWNDNEVAGSVFQWLVDNPADIILLHIGTNDLTSSPDDVGLILNEIDRFSEDTLVILALIINNKNYNPVVTEFNNNVRAMAEERIAHCDKIILVDMENAFNYSDDMDDNLHPNANGYSKMADVWFAALKPVLDNSYIPPSCTPQPSSQDLQAYYTFDQNTGTTVFDLSAYKRNGSIAGAVWAAGKSGNGLYFDGIDDYLSIPRINTDEISVSAWFYRNSSDTSHADALFGGWRWSSDKQSQEGFDIRFHSNSPDTLDFILVTRGKNGIKTTGKTSYTFDNSVGVWHHVAGTYQKATGEQKLYIDGKLVNTKTHPIENTIMPLAYYDDMRIGYSRTNRGYFHGTLDDIRIYNRALSSSEIYDMYNENEPIFDLTVTTSGNGTVSIDPPPLYISGQTVTLTATPDVEWIFTGWGGDISESNNPQSFIVTGNMAVTAAFAPGSSMGLQALYAFEEGTGSVAADSSGSGNNGIIQGAAWTTGKAGIGLEFDGVDDSVSVPLMNFDKVSISAWFYKYANDLTHPDTLLSARKWSSKSQAREGFELRFNPHAPDTLQFILVTEDSDGTKTTRIAGKDLIHSVGTWYHVTGTYNKNTGKQRLYINGQLAAIRTHPAGNTVVPLTYHPDIKIGYSRINKGYFHGIIDDVRIYNRTLNKQSVQDLYESY
ncbi:MAG: hypothetical protein E3K32_08035 [wastewater metagenome]|nr:hypothetical protein [Candidatus Loosdrechtia aerotolerans]